MKPVRQGVILSFAIAVLLFTAYISRHALLLIYVSCIFGVVMNPAVDWICKLRLGKRHLPRGLAIFLMGVVAVALLAAISFFAVPPMVAQVNDLIAQLPDLLNILQSRFGVGRSLVHLNTQSISGFLTAHMAAITTFFGTVASVVTSTLTVLLLTAYFTLEGENVLRWSMSLFPTETAERLDRTLRRAGVRMRRWLTGQLTLMLILGSASAVTFGLMHLRFFYILALFAGVANFVPFLGPLATVVLAGSVAAVDSVWKTVGVLIFYVVYQQIEAAYLTPKIMQAQVQLSPSAVIAALLIGSEISGVVGALVAVPSAVLVSVLIEEYVAHDRVE